MIVLPVTPDARGIRQQTIRNANSVLNDYIIFIKYQYMWTLSLDDLAKMNYS